MKNVKILNVEFWKIQLEQHILNRIHSKCILKFILSPLLRLR